MFDTLTPEQKLAVLADRDALISAQHAHDTELGAAHLAEKEALEKRISELVAKAESDALAAKTAADTALEQAKASKDSEIARLQGMIDRDRATYETTLKTEQSHISDLEAKLMDAAKAVDTANQERDAQVAARNEAHARQVALVERAEKAFAPVASIFAEAKMSTEQIVDAAKEAKRAALQAEMDKLA